MTREVKECGFCRLNQFVLSSRLCRKCKLTFDPVIVPPPPEVLQGPPVIVNGSFYSQYLPPVLGFLRLHAGLSQRDVARRMNVPRTYIAKLENWKAVPQWKSFYKLAAALETTPVHIFTMCEALLLT